MSEQRPNTATPSLVTLLNRLRPETASRNLQLQIATAESIGTTRYIFNPSQTLKNVGGGGRKLGIDLLAFPRMDLIPITAYRVPVHEPRAGGFAVGSLTKENASPSSNVGTKISFRMQYPKESVSTVLSKFGIGSTQELGFVEFESLATDIDAEKAEAELIWRAVMMTPPEKGAPRGVDHTLEELPSFLANDAPRNLGLLMQEGLRLFKSELDKVGDLYRVSKECERKGRSMIETLQESIACVTNYAIGENIGVLPKTALQLIASNKGQIDNKNQPDRRDRFYMHQFPQWSALNMPDTSGVARPTLVPAPVPVVDTAAEERIKEQQEQIDRLTRMAEQQHEQMQKLMEMNMALLGNQQQRPAAAA